MSQPKVNDLDPLLEFSSEPGEPDPVQPVDVPPDPPEPASPVAAPEPAARVTEIENALEGARSEIALLKSEVATLVGVVDDMKKRQNRRVIPMPVAPRSAEPPRYRAALAVAGLVAGFALGIGVWSALPGGDSLAPPAAAAEPAPAVAAEPVEPVAATPPPEPTPVVVNAVTPGVARVTQPVRRAPAAAPLASPVRYVGTLSIDAQPGGQVFINRQPAGQTPLRLTNLKAGSHLVWIERDGYRRFTRVVQVPADRVSRVSAELEPLAR